MKLFNVFGIDIDLHWSFVLLLAFVALVGGLETLAIIITLFTFVLLHELSHSVVAIHYGVNVKKITLLPIGGMAMVDELAMAPEVELRVAAAGPLFNFIAVGFLLLLNQFIADPSFLVFTDIAIQANLILGLFNLIPAIPLDGGRVWRSLRHRARPLLEATKDAVKLSKFVVSVMFLVSFSLALLFDAWGLLFWNSIIFLFILVGSDAEYRAALFKTASEGLTVSNALSRQFTLLGGNETLADIFKLAYDEKKQNLLIKLPNSKGYAIFLLGVLESVPVAKWRSVTVSRFAKPVFTASITQDVLSVWKKMDSEGRYLVPVAGKSGKLVGVVTWEGIERAIYLNKLRLSAN